MRMARLGLVWVFGGVLLAGCQDPAAQMMQQLGPAGEVVTASMKNLGWFREGREAESVRFTAIVTTWDEQGKSFTDRQQMVLDLKKNTLTSAGSTPQGSWEAVAEYDGGQIDVDVDGAKGVDVEEVATRMAPTVATMLHRLRGPYNLFGGKERARSVEEALVAGRSVFRVAVGGDNRRAIAYYFDADTAMLRFVTAGADSPGKEGTITFHEYASMESGRAFPSLIRVTEIGTHVVLGATPVFEAEISEVEF